MKISITSILLMGIILLTTCKEKEEEATVPSYLQSLTNGSYKDWELERVTYLLVDVTSRIPECQQDEIYRFYSDGLGEVRSGNTPCTTPEPDVQTSGTWEFRGTGENAVVYWQQQRSWDVEINKLVPDRLIVTGIIFDDYIVTAYFKPL